MSQVCSACSHSKRKSIDKEIVNNGNISKIAEKYNLSTNALYRHRDNHIGSQLLAGTTLATKNHGVALLESLDELVVCARRILHRAEADGHNKTALSALKESRLTLVSIMQTTHLLWQERLKESTIIEVSQEHQYINEQWGKNYKKLPQSEREAFQATLLKCMASTGPTHYDTEEVEVDPEYVSEEIPTMVEPYEVPESLEAPVTTSTMRRSKPRKPKDT